MYPPDQHTSLNRELCLDLIRAYPFTTLITAVESKPYTSYLPMILDPTPKGHRLIGHLDKRNPQVAHLENKITLIFQGPNTYISPEVYANLNRLPTWNYTVVEVTGHISILTEEQTLGSLIALSEFMAKDTEEVLKKEDTRLPHLLPHIVAFSVDIDTMVGRFKLSQDKPEEERNNALQELIEQPKQVDTALMYRLMEGK